MKNVSPPQMIFLEIKEFKTFGKSLGMRSICRWMLTSRLLFFVVFFLFLFLFQVSTRAWGASVAARLTKFEGKIDYRQRGSINWMPIGDVRDLQPGDLLFLKKSASAEIQYIESGTMVQLSDQTLFRVTQKVPVHSKRVHVFGFEKNNVSVNPQKKRNPFERRMVRNANEAPEGETQKESRLQVYRNVSEIALAKPLAGSIFVVRQFPAKLLVKIAKVRAENKYWVFVWGEEDNVTPIWSSYSNGEFSDITIDRPGTYEIQVFNENETEISDPLKVIYQKSDENFSDLGSKLSNLKGDQTVILE